MAFWKGFVVVVAVVDSFFASVCFAALQSEGKLCNNSNNNKLARIMQGKIKQAQNEHEIFRLAKEMDSSERIANRETSNEPLSLAGQSCFSQRREE